MRNAEAVPFFGCPLCAYTGSKHALYDEVMSYVTDNAHRVHLHELVTHVQAALSEHLQIHMTRDRIRQHQFRVLFVPGRKNISDFFTKALPVARHRTLAPFSAIDPDDDISKLHALL